ncbi:MAG: competence protein ComFB, partial [Spirochaetaceae bacterium]
MAAYALNNVSPRYRVNLLGRLISGTLDPEYQQELSKAVDEAVKVVTSNPGA